ncbi:Wzz/FepE/Etk N-terminal domain-containing protein [Edaphobacter paludis]|uniref:Wzz/FepE/Etk N-terminal domain-containing protein n=1 Tax=Edaphobacter paludis TaxID=3035702 RepID=A0AAU7D3U0_9BACT
MRVEKSDWIDDGLHLPTARDLLSILFRRIRVISLCFLAVFCLTLFVLLSRPQYKADMSILLRRERSDPFVTSNTTVPDTANRGEITEEELNSEAELLKSEDLLQKVVLDLHLQDQIRPGLFSSNRSEEVRMQKAIERLASNLQVRPIPKTDILSVSYRSNNPSSAARVLDALAHEYVQKHISVHRSAGELAFFEKEASGYQQRMAESGQRAVDFAHQQGVVDADSESAMALRRADEFEASSKAAAVSVAELQHQLAALEKEERSTPARVPAGQKRTDNPELLQMMKSSLLNLQTKEGEMSWRFQPEYPPLQDVRREITQTQHAIAHELTTPLIEDATDRNPLRDWVNNQLAQTRTELAAAQARETSDEDTYRSYRRRADQLLDEGVKQRALLQDAKAQADNYFVYSRRREEARVAEELNARGIVNVALSSAPHAFALPVMAFSEDLLVALFIAVFAAGVIGFVFEYLDDRIRTPEQLENEIGVDVLAAVPAVG